MKQKFFADHYGAAEKLWEDVGSNNVKIYDVQDYQNVAQIPVHPLGLTAKWTHVAVATSGEEATGRDWMIVAPYRLDASKATNEKCYDIDPVLFVLESDTGSPHPSGAVAYHQTFADRTTPVTGFKDMTLEVAVNDLRSKVTTGLLPLPAAPPGVLEAMQHMVGKLRADFIGESARERQSHE